MNKKIKAAMFAVMVVAAGYASVKTYQSYRTNDSALITENIEALSTGNGGDWLENLTEKNVKIAGNAIGRCWNRDVSKTTHSHAYKDNEGKPKYADCVITKTTYSETNPPREPIYMSNAEILLAYLLSGGIDIHIPWVDELHACLPPKIKTPEGVTPRPATVHNYNKN